MVPWDVLGAYPPWKTPNSAPAIVHNSLIADMVFQTMAWQTGARTSDGGWDPHILCGQPLANGLLRGHRYPPGWLWRMLEPEQAAAWAFALHLALGGIGTLLLAWRLRCGPHGSTLAGLAYALGGPAFLSMTFVAMQGAIALMPFGLLAVRGLHDHWERSRLHRFAWAALLALSQALSMLSGHPELTLYGLMITGAYAITFFRVRPSTDRHRSLGVLAAFAAAAAIAAFIAWPVVPALRDNFRTGCADMPSIRANALPAYQIAGFLAPAFAGSPVQHDYYDPASGKRREPRKDPARPIDWGDRNAVEGAVYLGLIPLALLALGGRPRRDVVFFCIAGVVALLLAFGTWLYAPYLRIVPMVSQLRTPVRWMIPASLALAVLAGAAFGRLQASHEGHRRSRAIGYAMLVAGLAGLLIVHLSVVFPDPFMAVARRLYDGAPRVRDALADPTEFLRFEAGILREAALWLSLSGVVLVWQGLRPRPLTRAVVVAVAALDLIHADYPFFTHAQPFETLPVPAEIRFLQQQPGLWRIATCGHEKILPPNTAALYGLDDIRGYESLIRRGYLEFLSNIEPQPDADFNIAGILRQPGSLASPWLAFLNVRYLLSAGPIESDGWRLAFPGQVHVYENERVLPRYYLAQPGHTAFDEGPPSPVRDARAAVLRHDSRAVDIETESPVAAWLVSSETDYGLWRVTVDGRDAPSTPVLGLFRGVMVPAGRHLVHWRLR